MKKFSFGCMKKMLLGIVVVVVCICAVLNGFGLVKTSNRPDANYPLSIQIRERIQTEGMGLTPEECVKYSLKLTSENLRFTERNSIANGKANCVGYAILCSSICNYALQINHLNYKSKPAVGYVTFYGINLCDVLKALAPQEVKNYVKDHDFVELELDDKVVFFDASLYDYHIDGTTIIKK